MAKHKRSVKKLEILKRRKNVAARHLRGQTQWEIADAFEVDQSTISKDLKEIHKEWLAASVKDRGEWAAIELAKIDEVERQAWLAFAKSQEPAETLRARMRGDVSETEKISKGQAGDPRFLAIINQCRKDRAALLGLIPTIEHRHVGADGGEITVKVIEEVLHVHVGVNEDPALSGPIQLPPQ